MPSSRSPLFIASGVFGLSAAVVVGIWAWLGSPVAMPPSPLLAGGKLDCVSYTPFQAGDSPFDGPKPIAAELIAADVARLAPITGCLRTYSAAGHGIEEVAAAAQRLGLTVMQGAWISRDAIANGRELKAAASIAKAHPGTVTAVIAGNEVLLRQEQTPQALVALIERAKALSGLPVTYADVWEFWLKNPQVAEAVDFITIHILPFWEDEPVAAADAAQHVADIYARLTAAFPDKRIMIGEVGWPSAGRMREAALPSPSNQARVLHDVIAMTRAKGITANIIEAFDQPWKRHLEGTVGGHWGLFDAGHRSPKYDWGQPVSNHPLWRLQAAGGVALAGFVLVLCAHAARKRTGSAPPISSRAPPISSRAPPISSRDWACAGLVVTVTSILAGLSFETLAAGAFGATGLARAAMLGLVALAAPFLAVGIAGETRLPSLQETIGPPHQRPRCPLTWIMGLIFAVSVMAAIQVALSLTFDPRYWEFPYAPIGSAAFAGATVAWTSRHRQAAPAAGDTKTGVAEKLGAVLLASCAAFIGVNEGSQNWQALCLVAALSLLAVTLWTNAPEPRQAAQKPSQ